MAKKVQKKVEKVEKVEKTHDIDIANVFAQSKCGRNQTFKVRPINKIDCTFRVNIFEKRVGSLISSNSIVGSYFIVVKDEQAIDISK